MENKKESLLKEIEEAQNTINELTENTFKKAKELAVLFLKDKEDKECDFSNFYENDCEEVYITYDGGNHPEYNANPFSCVSCVKLQDNNEGIDIFTEDGYMNADYVPKLEFIETVYAMIEYDKYLSNIDNE